MYMHVVNTADPFQRGVESQMPEMPDALLDTEIYASDGDAPNAASNSSVVHNWTCPAASESRRPRVP